MTSTANTATSFLPRSYSQGGYNVTINADRSIKVRPGDWLSKYSMAIYGNFDHVDAFWRKDDEGNFYEIIDKDLIDAGETLYHPGPLPNEPPGGSPGVAPPVRGTPGGKQPLCRETSRTSFNGSSNDLSPPTGESPEPAVGISLYRSSRFSTRRLESSRNLWPWRHGFTRSPAV